MTARLTPGEDHGVLLAVTIVYRLGSGLVSVPAGVVSRTAGGVVLRFEPKGPYTNAPGALGALLVSVHGAGHAVLLRPLDAPGRIDPDGGRRITFAFIARDPATMGFLEALQRVRAEAGEGGGLEAAAPSSR